MAQQRHTRSNDKRGPWASTLVMVSSLFLGGAATTLAAADGPTVQIDDSRGKKAVNVYNPVQVTGIAADPDGVTNIVGWIKTSNGNRYVTPDGSLSKQRTQIPLSFRQGRQVRWASQPYKLPHGYYNFTAVAVDSKGNQSNQVIHNFVVLKGANPNPKPTVQASNSATPAAPAAPAAPTAASLPLVAIQSPKNGSKIKGVAAFSGLARYAGGIAAVNAVVQDKKTGLFLGADGKFHRNAQLKMRVAKGNKPKWVAPRMQLPAGDYLFAVQSIAPDGGKSKWAKSSFTVVARNDQPQVINATNSQQQQQPAQQGNQHALAANGMPYCSADKDPDGDGFGWQNQRSCVVKGSRADTHPNCASSASDPDGDGYGWENERSCIVVTHCASAASDPDGDGFGWENNRSCVVLKTQGRHPTCASNESDPDGDGYGWENNKTCLVAR